MPPKDSSDDKGQGPVVAELSSSSSDAIASTETREKKSSGRMEARRSSQTLKERAKIPPSFRMAAVALICFECLGGVYKKETLQSWYKSMVSSGNETYKFLEYLKDLCEGVASGQASDTNEILTAAAVTLVVGAILYVLIWSPLRAGMWTGSRATRHILHRFMGLSFLIQYGAAWVEFITNYENGGANSFLPHFIALNGLTQGVSAFFSFKVLPELTDPGYYSDKAVLSRTFVHENCFFTFYAVFGSMYYNDILREGLRSHPVGRVLEHIFIFWPYIVIRTWFPVTRFSNAGSSKTGRSDQNQTFYTIGTTMVKIFYLWAKYFLGFYINFLIYLNLQSEMDIKFIRGLFLLNVGTVSIAVFLHTLRFKKVLPPVLTFSIYLAQIYATFLAIPYAFQMFAGHKTLCALCFSGILVNMTRNRPIHGVWCAVSLFLLDYSGVEW